MTKTIEDTEQQPQRFRDRAREIELEAALRRFWEFTRAAVPLDALSDDMQDECWALDTLGKQILKRKVEPNQ